jgi:DNA polymerase-3 subunit epsilon
MLGRESWRTADLVVIDVETTGLDLGSDRVISYAAVPVEQGQIRPGGTVYQLVNPGRPLGEESVRIHGILAADLADAPSGKEAFAPLAAAVRGHLPVAHAAWVERAFLGRALRAHRVRLPRRMLDTAALYRLLLIIRDGRDPGPPALRALATELGLPVHAPHHARGDALTTAQAFLALATHLEALGRGSIRSLRSAERIIRDRGRFNAGP